MDLTLDDYQKIAQIAFFIVVGTVTVLTYLKAKRGNLNSVNTEYHKQVLQTLKELSEKL